MGAIKKPEGNLEQFLQEATPEQLLRWFALVPEENLAANCNIITKILFRYCNAETDPEMLYHHARQMDPLVHQSFFRLLQGHKALGDNLSRQNDSFTAACRKLFKIQLRNFQQLILHGKHNTNDPELFRHALHQLITLHLYLQVIGHLGHQPSSEKEWNTLHRLFLLAERHSLAEFALKPAGSAFQRHITLGELYTFVLLLGCANLQNLPISGILRVIDFLAERSHLVTLLRPPQNTDNEMAIDLAGSSAPNFRNFLPTQADSIMRYLAMERLVTSMKNLHTGNTPFNRTGLNDTLKKHLLKAWTRKQVRERRIPVNKPVSVTFGLGNIHHQLCGRTDFNEFLGGCAELSIVYEEHEHSSLKEKERSHDIWFSGVKEAPAGELIHVELPKAVPFRNDFEHSNQGASQTEEVCRATLVDQSLHGCCLALAEDNLPGEATIGALVAIREDGEGKRWTVGEISWIRQSADSGLTRLGIRVIAYETIPVGIDIPLHHGACRNYAKGILLPFEPTLKLCTGLLTEEGFFQEGECLKAAQKGTSQQMKLTCRIAQKPHYHHFYCGFYV